MAAGGREAAGGSRPEPKGDRAVCTEGSADPAAVLAATRSLLTAFVMRHLAAQTAADAFKELVVGPLRDAMRSHAAAENAALAELIGGPANRAIFESCLYEFLERDTHSYNCLVVGRTPWSHEALHLHVVERP